MGQSNWLSTQVEGPMTETNRRVAALFRSMADLLESHRDNPHRIRAYRRAAESLERLGEDVAEVARRGGLRQIAGIGRDLSAKIKEFLDTGTVQAYDALLIPLPGEVSAWATLPGFSPSLIQHLYGRLGIRTLTDLETLVRSHLLRTLPGVDVSEEELLAAIHARQRSQSSP
jgi:DNA polymerase (family 10)